MKYLIMYIYRSHIHDHYEEAECGFDAERQFLKWADQLDGPVRVTRVERVEDGI